ncbi:mitochondrial SMC_prok_B domain-containing protein [Andalucia godoyi]|uniref:Mitochondrial SMC_prok_B domain-containing protein n=1 Tax=Andalucia godoyi TaxID=505711 RepID=A0A8K0F0U2_ANDGO|nr:mitochondrial SMC_prok_B domain-containing protein [Andalucia godoyi]|eukprot:ANDGO_05164.mRNA.1 mitochondrial SMC_prok_B domain-containing protein
MSRRSVSLPDGVPKSRRPVSAPARRDVRDSSQRRTARKSTTTGDEQRAGSGKKGGRVCSWEGDLYEELARTQLSSDARSLQLASAQQELAMLENVLKQLRSAICAKQKEVALKNDRLESVARQSHILREQTPLQYRDSLVKKLQSARDESEKWGRALEQYEHEEHEWERKLRALNDWRVVLFSSSIM